MVRARGESILRTSTTPSGHTHSRLLEANCYAPHSKHHAEVNRAQCNNPPHRHYAQHSDGDGRHGRWTSRWRWSWRRRWIRRRPHRRRIRRDITGSRPFNATTRLQSIESIHRACPARDPRLAGKSWVNIWEWLKGFSIIRPRESLSSRGSPSGQCPRDGRVRRYRPRRVGRPV